MNQVKQHRLFPVFAVSWVALLWYTLFCVRAVPLVAALLVAAISLPAIVLYAAPGGFEQRWSQLRLVSTGFGSSIVLYGLCWLGNRLQILFLPGGLFELDMIYSLKNQLQPYAIGVALIVCVAIAEELFWRKYIQTILMSKLGRRNGWFTASFIYAGIHVVTNNPALFVAALVAGLFWGWIYYRSQNIWVSIVSHVGWTILAFFLFPLQTSQGSGYV